MSKKKEVLQQTQVLLEELEEELPLQPPGPHKADENGWMSGPQINKHF